MKLLICSDIHGDLDSAKQVVNAFTRHQCDKLLILGDILYHGPRNDLPSTYSPKQVITLMNSLKDKIIAVRGNCEAEVDQMVLDFPVMADYAILDLDGTRVFATHGHLFNTQNPPKLSRGDVLLHGHTHVLCAEEFGDENLYLNPGSIALPKENNPRTYMVYENSCFTIYDLDGNAVLIANA